MTSRSLPRFERPPLVEMLIGLQFKPVEGLGSAHLGAFWKSLGADWPVVKDAPPLEEHFERFGDELAWGLATIHLALVEQPQTRLQIWNAAKDRMIQIQNGRFLYNWLRTSGGEYPHYETVRPEFDEEFARLQQFLSREGHGALEVNQWEVTYVNHIPRGELWNVPADWGSIFRWSGVPPSLSADLQIESSSCQLHYKLPPSRGRIHIHLTHKKDSSPGQPEALLFTLTARGPAGRWEGREIPWNEGIAAGHEALVMAFNGLTSEKAHLHWGLIHAGAGK